MMGEHARQNELWGEPVNLARRIPADHPLRKLRETLKLDFVREEVAGCYGRKGNVSVDPVIVMKMMLLLFWDNVRSERELMRIIPLRIDYLWFLGYNLEDEIPNHSVLSKARRRWGPEVFARLFRQSVQQCLEAGLIEGSKLHTDSSLVRADASLNSVVAVTLAKLEERAEEEPSKRGRGGGGAGGGPVNQRHRVMTDPDSALVRQTNSGKSHPSYKSHRALDDKLGVITAVSTTNGVRDDGAELGHLLVQHQANTARKPRAVVADCKYGRARTSSPWPAKASARTWVTCAAVCATTTRRTSIQRNAFSMMKGVTLTGVRRVVSFTGITLMATAVTMTIGHDLECVPVAGWPRTAPVPRRGAA